MRFGLKSYGIKIAPIGFEPTYTGPEPVILDQSPSRVLSRQSRIFETLDAGHKTLDDGAITSKNYERKQI